MTLFFYLLIIKIHFPQNKLFSFYKQRFIDIFFPIISSPKTYLNEWKLINRKIEIINQLRSLGHPFNAYMNQITIQRLMWIMEKRRKNKE